MARYIDADRFIEYLGFENTEEERDENVGEIVTLQDFDNQIAEDVQEVKCGQWIVHGFDETYNCYEAYCSNCEMELEMNFDGDKPYINLNTAYCPGCGAKMNGWCEENDSNDT